jgi:hypothetical protein
MKTKIKWYQWINPLFWLEVYVTIAVYQATKSLIEDISNKVITEAKEKNK